MVDAIKHPYFFRKSKKKLYVATSLFDAYRSILPYPWANHAHGLFYLRQLVICHNLQRNQFRQSMDDTRRMTNRTSGLQTYRIERPQIKNFHVR